MKRRNAAHSLKIRKVIVAGIALVAGIAIAWARIVAITPVIDKPPDTKGNPTADKNSPADPIDLLKKSGAIVFARPMPHDISGVRFTPDGKHITYERYGHLTMCSATTGEDENTGAYDVIKTKDSGWISPDGKRIVRMTLAGLLEVYAFGTSKPLFALRNVGKNVAYSQDGHYLATAVSDQPISVGANGKIIPPTPAGPIVIRDGSTGKIVRKFKSPYKTIGATEFSANGPALYMTNEENPVSAGFWDVVTGKRLFALNSNIGLWNLYALSPDGRWLCTSANAKLTGYNGVLVWNARTGVLEHTLTGYWLASASFSRDNRLIAVMDSSNSVRIWDTTTWKLLRTFTIEQGDHIYSAGFSPDGKRLVTCGLDIIVWNIADLSSGKPKP